MTGHRPFSDLKKNWAADRRVRNEARKAGVAVEYATLEELRIALGLSQEELAIEARCPTTCCVETLSAQRHAD